jgi:hypothetical protein
VSAAAPDEPKNGGACQQSGELESGQASKAKGDLLAAFLMVSMLIESSGLLWGMGSGW